MSSNYYIVVNHETGGTRVVCPGKDPTAWKPLQDEFVYAVCGSLKDARASLEAAKHFASSLEMAKHFAGRRYKPRRAIGHSIDYSLRKWD